MLGNAAGFPCCHVGFAQRIKQRGFAVIHVAHDGHDRCTRHQQRRVFLIIVGLEYIFHITFGHALELMAEFRNDKFRRIRINALVDRYHRAHFHKHFHDVYRALGHTVGELLHGNGFRDHHLADEFFPALQHPCRIRHALGFFTLAAKRGKAAHALFGHAERLAHGNLAGIAARFVAAAQASFWRALRSSPAPFALRAYLLRPSTGRLWPPAASPVPAFYDIEFGIIGARRLCGGISSSKTISFSGFLS